MTRAALLFAVVLGGLAGCASPIVQKATALMAGTTVTAPTVITALDARQKTMTVLDKNVAFLIVPIKQAEGGVTVWSSADNVQFTFRGDMLISTRGTGPDLMSSSGPSLSQIKTRNGPFARKYHFLDGSDQSVVLAYNCSVKDMLVPKGNRHVVEDCSGSEGSFRNEYLFGADGAVSETIQWLGSGNGRFLIK